MANEEKKEVAGKDVSLGFLALFGASVLSGFAGTLFELQVKKDKDFSVWLRALQLNTISMIPALGFAFYQDGRAFASKGFFHG